MVKKMSDVRLLFEHEDFFVVEKPAGMDFHDSDGCFGFFSQLKAVFKNEELYPVHRLDKETSGLLMVARSLSAAKELQNIMSGRRLDKFYLAISHKKPRKKQGTIKGDMVRSRRKSWKLLRSMDNPAITQFYSWGIEKGGRLFGIKIVTGKTHQIRVALKSLGAPILGDAIYSGEKSDRLYLHASLLRFEYKGETVLVRSVPDRGELWVKYSEKVRDVLDEYEKMT